jgi:hypothetical protein
MKKIKNKEVGEIFNGYPNSMRKKLLVLRQLVLDTALEIEGIDKLEETLRWGEPSYLAKGGTTIRMDWKKSKPDQYAMYFHCQTKLIDTFKKLYKGKFTFEGKRAIVFDKNDKIPINELKHCILLALTYHHRKHLPMLGIYDL